MANTSAVYARIDNELKKNAEQIMSQLGITPASVIQMLYSQIVLNRGLPFELRLPETTEPRALNQMSRAELDMALQEGIESMENEESYSIRDMKQIVIKQ